VVVQQAMPASRDAREAPPRAPDADIPFVPWPHLAVLNAFYRRRRALEATLAGRPVTIATTWPARGGDDVTDRHVIHLKIDAAEGEIAVPRPVLDALVATVDPALSLDRLGAWPAAIVIEFALSEVLATLETSVGCRLSLVAIHAERLGRQNGERVPLGLELGFDAAAVSTCELFLTPRDAGRLAHHLDRCADAEKSAIDLPFALCLRTAAATIGAGAIERLALDDVVLADVECRPDDTAIAVIGEHLVVPVELTPAGIVITARPIRGRGSSWEWSMDNPTEVSGPTGLDDSDFDDLPVRLVFELGRVELSLGEIQRLAPGALVPLARPLDEPLDIMANGMRLGRGTLVRIGESLGVRIVSLVGND
jgi:type III secretion protein Q